jgi:hypothetical protein
MWTYDDLYQQVLGVAVWVDAKREITTSAICFVRHQRDVLRQWVLWLSAVAVHFHTFPDNQIIHEHRDKHGDRTWMSDKVFSKRRWTLRVSISKMRLTVKSSRSIDFWQLLSSPFRKPWNSWGLQRDDEHHKKQRLKVINDTIVLMPISCRAIHEKHWFRVRWAVWEPWLKPSWWKSLK